MKPSKPGPGRHILVVEDHDDLRSGLADLLASEGYAVSVAENGLAAFLLLHEPRFQPSLVLLDLMMPVMDGITFLRRIRADVRLRKLPVVVMTATPNLCPSGVLACVTKPFSFDELMAIVSQQLDPPMVRPAR